MRQRCDRQGDRNAGNNRSRRYRLNPARRRCAARLQNAKRLSTS
jgi:hypothetical protein